ncbi:Iron-sulfur cluster carrier protein [archaeon HR01]|nr:Iron-sulfur cluster carrier protein [archaeon HR01]
MVSENDVLAALSRVVDPDLKMDIVRLRMVKDVKVEGDKVFFTLELTTPACPYNQQLQDEARAAVASIKGVRDVEMKVSSRVWSAKPSAEGFENIRNVVAVASGKGGVGKSTVAVNLALALLRSGARVGLVDADIYGPTIPKILKIASIPGKGSEGRILPARSVHGLSVVSMGLFMQDDSPVIWRGPLVASAVKQLITEIDWGELDYLVVDLPPGTGDASLTLAQTIPLSGVVIVTTPQEAAATIAAKALRMFRRLGIPILGIVENMSYFICPHCGGRSEIFGESVVENMAAVHETTVLARLPLIPEIGLHHDRGDPIVYSMPDSVPARLFMELAGRVAARISVLAHSEVAGGR